MEVRAARREELADVEAVRVDTWKVAYRGLVPDEVLDELTVTPERVTMLTERFAASGSTTLVALADGAVVGMAVVGPSRDADRADERELYALYVRPEHWGSGAGQALWDAGQPFGSLWVLATNARARAFYARQGFVPDETRYIDIGGPVPEVRYVSP